MLQQFESADHRAWGRAAEKRNMHSGGHRQACRWTVVAEQQGIHCIIHELRHGRTGNRTARSDMALVAGHRQHDPARFKRPNRVVTAVLEGCGNSAWRKLVTCSAVQWRLPRTNREPCAIAVNRKLGDVRAHAQAAIACARDHRHNLSATSRRRSRGDKAPRWRWDWRPLASPTARLAPGRPIRAARAP